MNDLVIGMAAGYGWAELEPFVVSLRRSGYQGRCVLMCGDRITPELMKKLEEYNIEVYFGNMQGEHPIVARFRIMAKTNLLDQTRYVLAVDTRDIVFQANPFTDIERFIQPNHKEILVVSEGVRYESSEGNKKNMTDAFGPQKYDDMRHKWVCNGGVIGGTPDLLKAFFDRVYVICGKDRRGKVGYSEMLPDQSAMNTLIRLEEPWRGKTKVVTARDGYVFGNHHFPLEFPIPKIIDGLIYLDDAALPVTIIHQYDQNDNFRDAVRARWKE
jgi:hypothetical protein